MRIFNSINNFESYFMSDTVWLTTLFDSSNLDAYGETIFSNAANSSYLHFYIHDDTTNIPDKHFRNVHYIRAEHDQELYKESTFSCSDLDHAEINTLIQKSPILQGHYNTIGLLKVVLQKLSAKYPNTEFHKIPGSQFQQMAINETFTGWKNNGIHID